VDAAKKVITRGVVPQWIVCWSRMCNGRTDMKLVKRLWNDEAGFIVSAELILIATIVVIGLLVGLAAVRDGIVSELSDVAGALQDVNQSYSIDGVVGHNANTAGFDYIDDTDECDTPDDPTGSADNCINFSGEIVDEGGFTASTSGGT